MVSAAWCIRGLVFLATLRANTFQVDAVNSSSGVYVTNSWRMCVCLAGGGRETCLLCKVSSLPLLCLSLHLPPPPCSHMVPQGAIIWQHPPPPHVTTSCHITSTYRVITPQENALASWGCTLHLIRRTNNIFWVVATHIWLPVIAQNKNLVTDIYISLIRFPKYQLKLKPNHVGKFLHENVWTEIPTWSTSTWAKPQCGNRN